MPSEQDNEEDFTSIRPRANRVRKSSVLSKTETDLHRYASQGKKSGSIAQSLDHERKSIRFTPKDREGHMHVIGSTGTGKSKFMELLLRQDILNNKAGLCLLDPHGSLYEEILLYASHRHPHLAERFVLFNPAEDMGCITGFNPIPQDAEHVDYIIQSLVSACLKAWGQDNTATTPRISRWLENIFYTVIANDLTLIESAPLMGIFNKSQREVLLRKVHSEVILDDWRMFESSNNTQKQSLIEGAANRLRKFIGNQTIRQVIGCRSRALDFTKVMQEGKIVLINLNGRNKITYENSSLLGIMMVNEIFRCAKFRNPRDPSVKPFYVYIDEFAQFITQDIARTLEEARKFKVFMILAHQHLAQLREEDEYLYASVMTNCKNKVVFGGLSREDAEVMTDELMTGFVDLKSIKDELENTKERHHLELRKTRSSSKSKGGGTNWSDGTTSSHTNTSADQRSTSKAVGKSMSSGSKDGSSRNPNTHVRKSIDQGTSSQNGNSTTNTESSSYTTTNSEAKGTTSSKGGSESWSDTDGESESWVNVAEEYKEVSTRTFWTKDELHYMEMAELKNQDTAHAFIKCGGNRPYKVKVDFVQPVVFNFRSSPKRVQKFIATSQEKNSPYYTSRQEALEETRQRQIACFGEELTFDKPTFTENTVPEREPLEVETKNITPDTDDSPFT